MSNLFIVLRKGDLDSVNVMGTYPTKILAVERVLELLKSQYGYDVYDDDRKRFAKRWFPERGNDFIPEWNDFEQYFENQLNENDKCDPLYIYYYEIHQSILN